MSLHSIEVRACSTCGTSIFHAYDERHIVAIEAFPTTDGSHVLLGAVPPRVTRFTNSLSDHLRFRSHRHPYAHALRLAA